MKSKKFISIALSLVLTVSTFASVHANQTSIDFDAYQSIVNEINDEYGTIISISLMNKNASASEIIPIDEFEELLIEYGREHIRLGELINSMEEIPIIQAESSDFSEKQEIVNKINNEYGTDISISLPLERLPESEAKSIGEFEEMLTELGREHARLGELIDEMDVVFINDDESTELYENRASAERRTFYASGAGALTSYFSSTMNAIVYKDYVSAPYILQSKNDIISLSNSLEKTELTASNYSMKSAYVSIQGGGNYIVVSFEGKLTGYLYGLWFDSDNFRSESFFNLRN